MRFSSGKVVPFVVERKEKIYPNYIYIYRKQIKRIIFKMYLQIGAKMPEKLKKINSLKGMW